MQQLHVDVESYEVQSNEPQQYLTFMLGGKIYGLGILNIKEIIEYGDITEVPMTPEFISGVINLRGSVVPVIDLSQRFSGKTLERTKRTSIIILELMNEDLKIEIGVTVDIVNEVLDIHPSEIEPAPSFGENIQTRFISGMAKISGKLLILLNIENLLSVEELTQIGSIQSSANE
ncbi:MAG: chemotaxis protein CheW [Moraxellaceae bacterium]|nr:MAG: chemotaxis protein CheW [Moraxellaceae bacterium]